VKRDRIFYIYQKRSLKILKTQRLPKPKSYAQQALRHSIKQRQDEL